MKRLLFIIVAFLALLGCKQDKDELTVRTENFFKEENVSFDRECERALIIPGGGCPGCIASGLNFVVDNKELFSNRQNKNVVIFTGIGSRKILRRRLGNAKIESLNAIVDSSNVYRVDFEAGEYPMVVYLKAGEIKKVESQNPESSALENLKQKLYE